MRACEWCSDPYRRTTGPADGALHPYPASSGPAASAVDLAHLPSRLAIEVDGGSHRTRRWRYLDKRKTEVLEALGWTVIRFWNHEVLDDTDRVIAEIRAHLKT